MNTFFVAVFFIILIERSCIMSCFEVNWILCPHRLSITTHSIMFDNVLMGIRYRIGHWSSIEHVLSTFTDCEYRKNDGKKENSHFKERIAQVPSVLTCSQIMDPTGPQTLLKVGAPFSLMENHVGDLCRAKFKRIPSSQANWITRIEELHKIFRVLLTYLYFIPSCVRHLVAIKRSLTICANKIIEIALFQSCAH